MTDLIQWNLFCNDYNLEHLNNISKDGLEIIKSFMNKDVKFKGLQRILMLYFFPISIPHINILSDLISLSYHVNLNNTIKIYIFGEYHYPTNSCNIQNKNKMNVFDFIKMNVFNTPKFIDLFLETAYIDKFSTYDRYKSPGGTLLKFESEYRKCLDPIKKCEISNLRAHNTDIRLTKTKKLAFIPFIHDLMFHIHKEIIDYQKSATNLDKYKYYLNLYKKTLLREDNLQEIFDYTNATSYPLLISLYIKIYNRMGKQLSKVDENVRKVLEQYMKDELNKLNFYYLNFNNIFKFMETLPDNRVLTDKKQIKELNSYTVNNLLLETIFMDMYLMARVFRTFDNKNKYENSNSPQNIIIYVGNKHAENYRKILNKLDFKRIFKTDAKYGEFCIDISKLEQPLFK
jgi:hypothetical protein